ncbi:MAG: outer membrane protein assembly factor BamB family protein [Planctomycetota bacterium]|jgi:outer membrane protein assembly factor BamB
MNSLSRKRLAGLLSVVVSASAAAAAPGAETAVLQALAKEITAAARHRTGLCVHLDCGDGALTVELARGGSWLVHALDRDPERVGAARQRLMAAGLYGQAAVEHMWSNRLPYASNAVDLLVLAQAARVIKDDALLTEALRVVAPAGRAVLVRPGPADRGALTAEKLDARLKAAGAADWGPAKAAGRIITLTKKRPPGTDDWTHWGYGPGGTFVCNDRSFRPPNCVQWLAGPSSPGGGTVILSMAGRTFYVIDSRQAILPRFHAAGRKALGESDLVLIARNAYNGLPLWRRRYSGNASTLVADGDRLITVAGDKLVALRADTGEIVRTYTELPGAQQLLLSGRILVATSKSGEDPTTVRAVNLDTGKELWTDRPGNLDRALIDDGKVLLYFSRDTKRLIALDLESGSVRWRCEPPGVVRFAKDGLVVVESGGKAPKTICGISTANGSKLWSYEITHEKVRYGKWQVRQAAGLVWVQHWVVKGRRGSQWVGLDPRTGKVGKALRVPTYIPWGCYPAIATERHLVLDRPNDLMEWASGKIHRFRASRNACGSSAVIAAGLYSTLPSPCACFPGMIRAFCAFAAEPSGADAAAARPAPRLVTGPAKAPPRGPARSGAAGEGADWPTYRRDFRRSASTDCRMPTKLTVLWQKTIASGPPRTLLGDEWHSGPLGGEPVTAPAVAGGRVFVGLPEAHRVVSLDGAGGRKLWEFTCRGRLDVPPSIHDGICLVGTRSGYVYGLRADNGKRLWRFRAAPRERRIVAYGQLESRWPVVGGVLVSGPLACVVSGRSTEIGGGLTVYALDPASGKIVWQRTPTRDHKTGLQGVADILVSDGTAVAIGGSTHAMFDLATGRHLPRGQFHALRAASRTNEKGEFIIRFGPEGDNHACSAGTVGSDGSAARSTSRATAAGGSPSMPSGSSLSLPALTERRGSCASRSKPVREPARTRRIGPSSCPAVLPSGPWWRRGTCCTWRRSVRRRPANRDTSSGAFPPPTAPSCGSTSSEKASSPPGWPSPPAGCTRRRQQGGSSASAPADAAGPGTGAAGAPRTRHTIHDNSSNCVSRQRRELHEHTFSFTATTTTSESP